MRSILDLIVCHDLKKYTYFDVLANMHVKYLIQMLSVVHYILLHLKSNFCI